MKRIFDFITAALALSILSIPLLFLTWLIAKKLGKPIFFVQLRPGKNGFPFNMLKFRTMTETRGDDGALLPDNERLTSFGKMLRATSLFPMPTWALQMSGNLLSKGDAVQRLSGNLQVDISKARDLLGWTPPLSVEEGLKRAVGNIEK